MNKQALNIYALEVEAFIGVDPVEKLRTQILTIDLRIDLGAMDVCARDHIEDTINYAHVARVIRHAARARHFNLIESLGNHIVDELRSVFDIDGGELRVVKPGCIPDAFGSAYQMTFGKVKACSESLGSIGLVDRSADVGRCRVGTDYRPKVSQEVASSASSSQDSRKVDVVIIGGGPAGLSTYHGCCKLGLKACLIADNSKLGGQLNQIYFTIRDFPLLGPTHAVDLKHRLIHRVPPEDMIDGVAISVDDMNETNVSSGGYHCIGYRKAKAARSIASDSSELICSSDLAEAISFESQDEGQFAVFGRAIVIASGVRRRRLTVFGTDEWIGRGLLSTASLFAHQCCDRHVAVIGGGDAALENALKLAAAEATVSLIHRGEAFSARSEFITRVEANPRIRLLLGVEVISFETSRLDGSTIEQIAALRLSSGMCMPVDFVLCRVGWLPNTDFLPKAYLNASGYVRSLGHSLNIADNDQRLVPWGFACGDVRAPRSRTLSTAAGDAAQIARAIADYL